MNPNRENYAAKSKIAISKLGRVVLPLTAKAFPDR